jgi:hypothetical protein
MLAQGPTNLPSYYHPPFTTNSWQRNPIVLSICKTDIRNSSDLPRLLCSQCHNRILRYEPLHYLCWADSLDRKYILISLWQGNFSFVTSPKSRVERCWVGGGLISENRGHGDVRPAVRFTSLWRLWGEECVLMVTSSGDTLEKYSNSPESSCRKPLRWDELNC